MVQRSAGILFHRGCGADLAVLLVLPGGPYWRNRDVGAWQIPKGQVEAGEDAAAAARREVHEELGVVVRGELHPLPIVRQSGGKLVEAFAVAQDVDADAITSIDFELEWPPNSGRIQSFPEVDRARWFTMGEADAMILASQQPLLTALRAMLAS